MEPSRELAFLLYCVGLRTAQTQGKQTCLQRHLPNNWRRFIRMAQRHRLVPHVCDALRLNGWNDVPDSARDKLKALYKTVVMKNCRLGAELKVIVEQFRKVGIPIRPFKGPTLAIETQGGLECRQFNDLDLMINPANLNAALKVLQDCGYHPELSGVDKLSQRRTRQLTARNNELTLTCSRPNGVIAVDLHWRYSTSNSFFETSHDKLFCSEDNCMLGGSKIPTIPMNQQIVYLAYHACKHQCMRLGWLCDFAVAINQIPRKDWAAFISELESNCRRMVICALLMLEKCSLVELLEDCIPDAVGWRRQFEPVTNRMYEVMTAEKAVLLLGAFATGVWQLRVSGRVRAFTQTFFQAILPAQHDLLQPGMLGPWQSRFKTICGIAAQQLSVGELTTGPLGGSSA